MKNNDQRSTIKDQSDKKKQTEESQEKEKSKYSGEQIDYKNKYLRALADYHNLVKRVAHEREEFTRYANESFIVKLLPILDGLEKAKETISETGIELIYKELWNIMSQAGVTQIEVKETDEFNPTKMECIEAEQGGKKLQVLRRGYTLKGKIIRPVQVKVVQ